MALTFSGALEEPPKEFKPAVSDLKKKKIKTKQKKVDITATLKSAKGDKKKSKKKADDGNHPQMAHALKGHAGTVTGLDFTGKGTILCSTSVDRTLRAWKIKPHQEHIPYTRVNMKFDHATACAISADSRGVAVATKEEKKIQVYKVSENVV